MTIGITGATGFVGRPLADELRRLGHQVREISLKTAVPTNALEGCDAVVNLAGEPIAQRWTDEARAKIRSSRVEGTRALVNAMRIASSTSPRECVCGRLLRVARRYPWRNRSRLQRIFLGRLRPSGKRKRSVRKPLGVRVARVRFGMVLGPNGGALKKMLIPFPTWPRRADRRRPSMDVLDSSRRLDRV